ncbi:hypothetical protein OHT57_07440 [Streptomyces sp. NBC_00285]|uniref:hypothetical protein n=1 Tax=Streptomyces sp. NBC_00285 TaxID=2975700 RepID=UPI002E2A9363|nr:hypothetical protein [Streptomyces sp. NBC_00285]
MVLAPCHRGPARSLLVDISRQCRTELPDVAAALVATWEGEPLPRRMCSSERATTCTWKRTGSQHERHRTTESTGASSPGGSPHLWRVNRSWTATSSPVRDRC